MTLRVRNFVTLAATIVSLAALGTACKQPPKGGRTVNRTVKASVAGFDANANIQFDLSKYGSERVDDWQVQQAFDRSFTGMDACVASAKAGLKLGAESQLEGDVDFEVKLNPESGRPFGVNATLSKTTLDQNAELKDCLREAVASVGFPTYNGPPAVAVFSTQLDPGSVWVEDE